MKSSTLLEKSLLDAVSKGLLTTRTENNRYLKCSYKGAGTKVSEKWNVKIYTSGSVVCNDEKILEDLMSDSYKDPDNSLQIIQFDDAGIGFPLCGVMIGMVTNKKIWTDTVDVRLFQSPHFEKKEYLQNYAEKGINLLQKIGANPKTNRIEICTGFINTRLRDILRDIGYDVRVTEIKGLLQDQLEHLFRSHVKKETGQDLAYDPKKIQKENLGRSYYSVLNWGKAHTPHLLKSGWGSMK
jgi:hypothetical protein